MPPGPASGRYRGLRAAPSEALHRHDWMRGSHELSLQRGRRMASPVREASLPSGQRELRPKSSELQPSTRATDRMRERVPLSKDSASPTEATTSSVKTARHTPRGMRQRASQTAHSARNAACSRPNGDIPRGMRFRNPNAWLRRQTPHRDARRRPRLRFLEHLARRRLDAMPRKPADHAATGTATDSSSRPGVTRSLTTGLPSRNSGASRAIAPPSSIVWGNPSVVPR